MLRAELYSGLEDAIHADDDNINLNNFGQCVVLPLSYIGGLRHMGQRFQDSMAIARYYQSVDIFMTMTTNPEWSEITRELLPGQHPSDCPDLIAHVFHMKKKAIIDEVYKKGVFGRAVAYGDSVEFHKHGLPHFHMLIFFEQGQKLLIPEDINSVIWARWPDPETEPSFFRQ
jgi:hypothetical protein